MLFRRERGKDPGGTGVGGTTGAPESTPDVYLDNRGLQPPEPMVRILTALDQLQPGQVLQAHNDRRPMFLLPHLEERGFQYAMADQDDGSVVIRIWHRGRAERESARADRESDPPFGKGESAAPQDVRAGEPAGKVAPADAGTNPGGGKPDAGGTEAGPKVGAPAAPGDAGVEPLVMDVRPYFARRQEPFRDIMANVGRLKPGQPFVLIVGFEPVPLYWVLKRKGFEHRAERQADGAWRVTFWRMERSTPMSR